MIERHDGGAAFPRVGEQPGTDACPHRVAQSGMSLRDYFAAHALQGLLAQSGGTVMSSPKVEGAKFAYEMADAMLEARKK